MGYNGREFREPYKLGATSNGIGSFGGGEGLAASMSSLSVSGADQSTSGSNDAGGQSGMSQSTSSSSLSLGRTNLNPHAAEFVPNALKGPTSGSAGQGWDGQKSGGEKEGVGSRLDRTNSSNSNASDDEYRRFCRSQLPDDLMPEFEFGEFVESAAYEEPVQGVGVASNSWSGGGVSGSVMGGEQFAYDERVNQNAVRGGTTFGGSGGGGVGRFGGGAEGSSSSVGSGFVRPYMPELRSPGQQVVGGRERQVGWSEGNESGASGAGGFGEWGGSELTFPEDLTTESNDPVGVLALEFPGFSSESLAEIYYANGGDLGLTIDMLSELELQNEGASVKQFQAAATPAPPSARDFPALAGLESMSGSAVGGRGSVGESRAIPDFAAAVRKQAAAQAAQLQFERNGGVEYSVGGGRGLAQGGGVGGYGREGRVGGNERLDHYGLAGQEVQAPATWLETGDSVSNMYADMREEARDHARVRNAYFDQARQAYITGNKALAKELSAKGQWHNEQMKAAHSKAGEAIFYHRNANTYVNSNSPGQPQLIDLHGLHVGEAIPLLKREIAQLRYNVRSTRQRAHVFIVVGTGHHTKGSRTPSRLPAAVQRYLLEEEHIQYTEPQAGMLRIIIR